MRIHSCMGASSFVVTTNTPQVLEITAPGSSMMLSWFGLGLLLLLLLVIYTTSRTVARLHQQSPASVISATRYRMRSLAILVPVVLLAIGIFYSSGSIRLDRAGNSATMRARMTCFLPARTLTIPLTNVDQATLDAQPNARRIRLEATHGHDLAFPIFSSRAGQDDAVRTINQWLRP